VVEDGKCAAHSGKTDMRAIGAAGGRASVRSRLGLGDVGEDEREKARRRLSEMLDSPDERMRMMAAKALYSYSAVSPPHDAAAVTPASSVEHDYGAILDVLEDAGVVYRGPGPRDERRSELSAENSRLQARVRELERELGRTPQTLAESKSVEPKPAEVTSPAPAPVAPATSTRELPHAGEWLFGRERQR
jgi:hypothetical protein